MKNTIGILGALSQLSLIISVALLLLCVPCGIVFGLDGSVIGWIMVKSCFSCILNSFFYCAMVDLWEKHFA